MAVLKENSTGDSTRIFAAVSHPGGSLPDEEVIARVRAGETGLFELILRRYNQRLYRIARAIVADDEEAEDALQTTYLRAYSHLAQFEGRSSFATWLARIAINEARSRRLKRSQLPADGSELEASNSWRLVAAPAAEQEAARGEMRYLLESAIEQLPESFRTVFVLREVEQMATSEVAQLLDIPDDTVKTRLYRARGLLRKRLAVYLEKVVEPVFGFAGARCDHLVATVMAKIVQR